MTSKCPSGSQEMIKILYVTICGEKIHGIAGKFAPEVPERDPERGQKCDYGGNFQKGNRPK